MQQQNNKKLHYIVFLFGFVSGFTLMLSGNTLNFWLSQKNIDITTIGIFSVVSLPYAINFLWAPIMDVAKIKFLEKLCTPRLSCLVPIQISLAVIVFITSYIDPSNNIILFGSMGFIIAFFSSTQDIIIGSLRTEIVDKDMQGPVAGSYILGYRVGLLLSSSGAIYISIYLSWSQIYQLFALLILFFPFLLVKTLKLSNIQSIKNALYKQEYPKIEKTKHNILDIPKYFGKIINSITNGNIYLLLIILLFLILYRLPDNFISAMMNPFLVYLQYSKFEIASAGKFFGVLGTIFGGFIASKIMYKQTITKSLYMFGIIHAFAHLIFIAQALLGKNIILLFVTTCCESISGGMAMSAYIAFIASLCKGKFRGTQYSFLSSMMGLSRSILPTLSGYIIAYFGWITFYLSMFFLALPAIMLICYISKQKNFLDNI